MLYTVSHLVPSPSMRTRAPSAAMFEVVPTKRAVAVMGRVAGVCT